MCCRQGQLRVKEGREGVIETEGNDMADRLGLWEVVSSGGSILEKATGRPEGIEGVS